MSRAVRVEGFIATGREQERLWPPFIHFPCVFVFFTLEKGMDFT